MMATLTHIVETANTNAVKDYNISKGRNVSCTTNDGMIVDGKYATWELSGGEWVKTWEDKKLLEEYSAISEQVCPGINQKWAWKRMDHEIYQDDKPTGKELRVPPGWGIQKEIEVPEFDREHPEYETLFEEVRHFCLQVGTNFVNLRCEENLGKISLYDEKRLRVWFRTWNYYTLEESKEFDPKTRRVEVVGYELVPNEFFEKWLKDPRRKSRFLPPHQQDKATMYDYFGVHPDPEKCPHNCYNTWTPFAAQQMTPNHTPEVADRVVHLLNHLFRGCNKHEPTFNFLLDLIAHSLKWVNDKPGIMLCLCGIKGASKTTVWELIVRLAGVMKTFLTGNPGKDCFGDNNGAMMSGYWIRLTEMEKRKFKDCLGEMKTHITDKVVRIRELYCKACNVPSFHRYFGDSNWPDAFPDDEGERRFFIIWWMAVELGNKEYYTDLYDNHINNDDVIQALYHILIQRDVARRLTADDIVVTEFQQQVKDCNRSLVDRFLLKLIEDQPFEINKKKEDRKQTLHLSSDEIYHKFTEWQVGGKEYERSNTSLLKGLDLCQVDGISKKRELDSEGCMRTNYYFDIHKLRVKYRIEQDYEAWKAMNDKQVQEDGSDSGKKREIEREKASKNCHKITD